MNLYENCSEVLPSPELKVYFSGNFWGHARGERRGRELPLRHAFSWAGERWQLLSLYLCGPGLVVELCKEVPPEKLKAFWDKWEPLCRDEDALPPETREQALAENPLALNADLKIFLNGRPLQSCRGCASGWAPCPPAEAEKNEELAPVLAHYGLEPTRGWLFWRSSFRWATKRRPVLRDLRAVLSAEPTPMTAGRFTAKAPGQTFSLRHPLTGREYTLAVQELAAQSLSESLLPREDFEYPTHFTQLVYTLSPALGQDKFSLADCSEGDRPRPLQCDPLGPKAAASIGVIGGAVSVAALQSKDGLGARAACSSLHFSPAQPPTWRAIFHETTKAPVTVELALR